MASREEDEYYSSEEESLLELYHDDKYVAAPYLYKEEPWLPFHESEHKYTQQRNINWYNTKHPQD